MVVSNKTVIFLLELSFIFLVKIILKLNANVRISLAFNIFIISTKTRKERVAVVKLYSSMKESEKDSQKKCQLFKF